MSAGTDPKSASSMALRHTFVSMLFALVIAETAIQASNIVAAVSTAWEPDGVFSSILALLKRDDWLVLAPATHLLLGFILICTSWVGWSRSIDKDKSKDVDEIFSVPFVQLLIELLLVVLYFVLVRSVEIGSQSNDGIQQSISSPSAAPEAFWLMAVYGGYVVWDVFADVLNRHFPEDKRPMRQIPFVSVICTFATGFITRCWVSILCTIAAWVVYKSANNASSIPLSAVLGDLALLCVVFWFWLAKVLEPKFIENVFPWERYRKGGRKKDPENWQRVWIVILPIAYIAFVLLM